MIVEIQVLPSPGGTSTDRWAHVDAAIAVIARSGLPYEVGPLGTSIEGSPDVLWPLMRAVHDACLGAGADQVVSVIKLFSANDTAPTMRELVAAHRPV